MKKYFFFALTFLSGLNVFGQIPNSSFETWTLNPMPHPQGWYIQNTPVTCVTQYTNAYQGSSAFMLESFAWMGQGVDTYLNTGTTSSNFYVPTNAKPTKLFGWYLFQGSAPDRMTFNVSMKSVGNVIGTGSFSTATSTSVYTQFTASINYSSVAVPDSFRIVLSLNNAGPTFNSFATAPSNFVVDDLSFDTDVGIRENNFSTHIKVYPNPTKDFLIFQNIDNLIQISSVKIFDSNGRLLNNYFMSEKLFELNVQDYNAGIYFYKITDTDGKTKTEKFVKQ